MQQGDISLHLNITFRVQASFSSIWPFSPKKTAPAGRDLALLWCLKCDCIYVLRKTHKAANWLPGHSHRH